MSATSQKNLRFPSLTHDPSRARASLRDRLERFLPASKGQVRQIPSDATISDEAFLRLLLAVQITRSGTIENADAIYRGLANPDAPYPTLSSLVVAGWVRTGLGRVYITVDAVRAAQKGLVE
jgi:hypothetical protein